MGKIMSAEKRVEEIKRCINSNLSDCSTTMETIAQLVGLNPRYMLRIFKEQTGTLLKDYVLKIRIDKAKELLEKDMTIEMVARNCGYTSSHSFIRAFKRTCGMTPGEFKRKIKEE